MTTAAAVRQFAQELRPVIDRGLDDAEIIKGLRDAATDKGIDWSQLKALVKAQAQDARDGGTRLDRMIEKAGFAAEYADMLRANMNENNETRSSSAEPERPAPIKPRPAESAVKADNLDIPNFLDRRNEKSVRPEREAGTSSGRTATAHVGGQ